MAETGSSILMLLSNTKGVTQWRSLGIPDSGRRRVEHGRETNSGPPHVSTPYLCAELCQPFISTATSLVMS
jgi:hypothetical protein